MKKIGKNLIKAVLCMSVCCVISAPAFSVDLPTGINANEIMQEGGMNYRHDMDIERFQNRERYIRDDYTNRQHVQENPEPIQNKEQYQAPQDVIKATVDELDTKGVYINSVQLAPSEILTKEETDPIIQKLVGRNVFISDIQAVIDEINTLYANKGYVTAKAFLPEQTVTDGNIYIDIIESRIGNISVEENRWTRTKYITDRLPQKEGELFDIVDLEQDVLDFNRYNEGVKLSANLKAGEKPGTTDIEIKADEKFPFHLVGVMDNQGRYSTGNLRGGAMLYADSLFGLRDKMSIGTYLSGGVTSPFFDYNIPVNKYDGRVGFLFSSGFAKVKWGPFADELGLKSKSYQYSLYYTQPIVRKPGFELKGYVAANYKRARVTIFDDAEKLGVDNVTSVEAALNLRKDTKYGIWYASQGAYYAIPILNSDTDNHYFKYSGAVVRLHDFSHGFIGQLRSNYQIIPGSQDVPYLDQLQAGGLATVRGYSEGMMIGKNGYFVSGELMFPLLPREITSPRSGQKIPFIGKYVKGAIFADHAGIFPAAQTDYGSRNSYFMASVGMGLRVQLPGDLSARLYWGYPILNDLYYNGDIDNKYGRFHFELTMAPDFDALLRSRHGAPQAVEKHVEAEYINNYNDVRHYDYYLDGGGGNL